jgi:hypothetical protein
MVISRHKGHMAHQLYHFYILTWKLGCVSLAHRIAKLSIKCWKTLPVFCICIKQKAPKQYFQHNLSSHFQVWKVLHQLGEKAVDNNFLPL